MVFIVENGAGLRNANAYASHAFVTTYLTERGRETENSWDSATDAQKEDAIIAATDYIDTRWGQRFRGIRQTNYQGAAAQGKITVSGTPVADETMVVGNETYTFKSTLEAHIPNQILISGVVATQIDYIVAAINGVTSTGKSTATQANQSVTASEEGAASIFITALQVGTTGNDIVLTSAATGVTVDYALVNGLDDAPQSLEFPRTGLVDRNGQSVLGVPLKLRQATAEYAIRAHAASLFRDPTVSVTGQTIKETFTKLGPIEEKTVYQDGSSFTTEIKPFPAADKLLAEYIFPGSRVIR